MRFVWVLMYLMVFSGVVVRAELDPGAGVEKRETKTPRVALLVDEPDLEALLVAGFSGVETLGRAELPKLAAERLLAGGSLGLTDAEVALVVERNGDRGVVKVVQCESGATVVVLELPKMPVEETARWIVARTQPLLGAVADPFRPRISLTGLRFVTDSAENRVTERAINLMLTARLQARGAVVLERWRMGDLVFEKSLATQESPFWKAAEIVDGSASADGGRLSARVRIRGAAGAETFAEAEGGTAGDLVDAIVIQVMAGSWKTDVGTKKETEAAAFLTEAKWMLEHGLPREAWQATESALALGVEPRREAEMLRVKAAAMCAYRDDLGRVLMRDGHYRAKAFALVELPARVAAATEAMLLAGDYWNAHPTEDAPERRNLQHPATLGVQSLYTGLRVLRTAHDSGWAEANADAVRGLREAIRRNETLLREGPLGDQRWILFVYLANYVGYWTQTPAEAVAFYRMVLDPDFDAGLAGWPEVIRNELSHGASAYGTIPRPPFLTGTATLKEFPGGIGAWRVPGGNDASARAAWGAFLDELDRSPHVLNQADGLALRWQSTADKKARLALTARIADFVSAHVDDLAGPHGFAIFGQLVEPLSDVDRSSEFASEQEKMVGLFLSLIHSEAQVSPALIGCVKILFSTGGINTREDQGRQLIAALDARGAGPAISRREIAGIDAARLSIWKKFPSLRPAENAKDPIIVRSLWIAAEHTPDELRNHVGFDPSTAVWHDNRLWVLDSLRGRLWQIDPQSGNSVILSPENRPQRAHKAQLVAWGKQFAITAERGVWVLGETRKRWEKLDLPAAGYQIGVAHGDLWTASGYPLGAGM